MKKNTKGLKTSFGQRCLYLIPNIIILVILSFIIYITIGTLHIIFDSSNLFYKSPEYNNGYSILFFIGFIVGMIMRFIPTKTKLYSISKGFLIGFLVSTLLVYCINNFNFQQELQIKKNRYQIMQWENANKTSQKRGYDNIFDELNTINSTNGM